MELKGLPARTHFVCPKCEVDKEIHTSIELNNWVAHINFHCQGKKVPRVKPNLTCEICHQSYEHPNTHLTEAVKLEMFNSHYCQVAERNKGHFVVYEVRDEKDYLIEIIKNSPITSPTNTHKMCFSEQLCIPGTDMFIVNL